jgi:hypothetical protein
MIVGLLKHRVQVSIFTISIVYFGLIAYSLVIPSSFYDISDVPENLLFGPIFGKIILNSLLYQIITFAFILIGAVTLTVVSVNHELISKTNLLPAFFYCVFSFSAVTSVALLSILISNAFVILGLNSLYNSYRRENALFECFNAGICISLASCFYTYYFLIIPIGIIAIMILKSFNWREWMCFIFGTIMPIYIYSSVSYVKGLYYSKPFDLFISIFHNSHLPLFSEYYLLFIGVTLFMLVLALFHYISKGFGNRVKIQKAKFILIWLSVFCLIISFISSVPNFWLLPCIVPFSIMIGDYLGEVKRLKIANTLLTLFMGGFLIIWMYHLSLI